MGHLYINVFLAVLLHKYLKNKKQKIFENASREATGQSRLLLYCSTQPLNQKTFLQHGWPKHRAIGSQEALMWKRMLGVEAPEAAFFHGSRSRRGKNRMNGSGNGEKSKIGCDKNSTNLKFWERFFCFENFLLNLNYI